MFDWSEYIWLAENISLYIKNQSKITFDPSINFKQISEESLIRCFISRCYYGIFCSARNKANKIQQPKVAVSSNQRIIPGSHKEIISKYKNSSLPDEKEIGDNLEILKRKRERADYEDVYLYSKMTKDQIESLAIAKSTIQLINSL